MQVSGKAAAFVIALLVTFLAVMRFLADEDQLALFEMIGEIVLVWIAVVLFVRSQRTATGTAPEVRVPENGAELELQELRRQQKLLIDRAVDVIMTVDFNGKIISINEACRKAWLYERSDLLNRDVSVLMAPDEYERVKVQMQGGVHSIDKVVFESRVQKKDGDFVDVVWTGHWSASEGGLFCIVHDMTQQKLVENAIRENERRLRQFSAMITHDLKTPLTAIGNTFTILEAQICGNISEQALQLVRTSKKQLEHTVRLLEDMLQVASMDAGTFELECAEVEMHDLVRDAAETMRAQAETRGVGIEVQVEECVCDADEQRLTQVLINLLSNAIKYSGAGSLITVSLTKGEDGCAKVAVRDRGRGIPAAKLESIFERYAQVETADSREKGGYGLGLAICKNIVEQHGGQIGVESKEGEGSTFWFSLSLRDTSLVEPSTCKSGAVES